MRQRRAALVVFFGVIGIFGGCEPLTAPSDPGSPIWTIRGSITNSEGVSVEGDLRVALMWINDYESDEVIIAQDVSVTPSFPTSFSIELHEPPPSEALLDFELYDPEAGISGSVGMAYVIVYDDRNGDEQFTLTGPDDREFVDHVLAISDSDVEYMVWYVATEEPWEFEEDTVFEPGFHVLGPDTESDSSSPDDVLIELEIVDDPTLNTIGCDPAGGWQYYEIPPVASIEEIPSELKSYDCMGRGDNLRWVEQCPGVEEILPCTLIDASCTVYQTNVFDQEPPADWPCEIYTY